MRVPGVSAKYQTALLISGLVTFIKVENAPMLDQNRPHDEAHPGGDKGHAHRRSALMTILGYPGESNVSGDNLWVRWIFGLPPWSLFST